VPCRLQVGDTAAIQQIENRIENLYSLPGVVHRLDRSLPICSTGQTVNNAVAMTNAIFAFLENSLQGIFGLGSGTNMKSARWTSLAQPFDRSPHPNADTHSQVLTTDVCPYTACAPRSTQS
jgi:hypothetical protein